MAIKIHRYKRHLKNIYNLTRTQFFRRDKTKYFGIGRNKTGTTSLAHAMRDLGFVVGNQRTAELLFDDWRNRNFSPIIRYCHTAQFFQDVPFSLPDTFIAMDKAFPGSKFILTIRDNPEQWYSSATRFYAKIWGKNGRIPTREDLQEASYIFKGRPWYVHSNVYPNIPEDDPYNKKLLIQSYIDYNNRVIEYFKNRPDDLLILNVAEKSAYQKLCIFLNRTPAGAKKFPWENKT